MPLSKHVQIETLKTQHDEIEYIASELQELYDSLEVLGLNIGGLGTLDTYAGDLRGACSKIKAVIGCMESES